MLELLLSGGKKKVVGMTYTDFVTWLNNNSNKYTPLSVAMTATPSTNYQNAYIRLSMNTDGGTMWGTPYLNWFTYDSPYGRIVRHACPSVDVFNYIVANKQYCLLKLGPAATKGAYPGLNRNGYSSSSYTSFTGRTLIDFIYYDTTLGVVMRWNPLVGGTPTVFDGTLV